MRAGLVAVLGLAVASAGCGGGQRRGGRGVQLILHGGDVWTMDPARPRARTVAIDGGRVVAVGGEEVLARRGPATRVIELGGRVVLPGLVDGHAHLGGLGRSLEILALRWVASEAAVADLVRAAAARLPAGAWIQGRGWDQNLWTPKLFPTRASLDAAAPGSPVILRRVDGHAAWVSSEVLKRAGIDRTTADPPGGLIERDAAGEPTGVLVDNAMELVARVVPEADDATIERWILAGARACLEVGLVGVHDMGVDEPTAAVYRRLAAAGKLPLRVYGFVEDEQQGPRAGAAERALAREPERGEGRFKLGGIKLYADGALGSRGAALLADYADDPGNTGLVLTTRARIEELARGALAHGWQIGVHAIGDRANRDVLDAYAAVLQAAPVVRKLRWRVEHAQVVAPEDLGRFGAMEVIAAMQPVHATSDMPWAEARLGPARVRGAYAWRSILAAGGRIVGGSDFPVEEATPLAGLYAAITRQDRTGAPEGGWYPEQRMTVDEALAAFTTAPAYAAFEEATRGRLAPGFAADVTVLDAPAKGAASLSPAHLLAAKVALTLVDGAVAFEAK